MICFFVSNPMSAYYRSKMFSQVLEKVSTQERWFELKNKDQRLRVISRNIDSTAKALEVLRKL